MDVPPAADRVLANRSPIGGGPGRPALLVAVGIVAIIAVAVLKPWEPTPVPPVATTEPSPPRSASPAAPDTPLPAAASVAPGALDNAVHVGPLDPGTYTSYGDVDRRGFNIASTVPAGWTWDGTSLRTGERGEDAQISFVTGDVRVYPDPCHWLGPEPEPTAPGTWSVVAALAAQRGRRATAPVERAALNLVLAPRWDGAAIELTVPDDLDIAACDEGQFHPWVLEPEVFLKAPRLSVVEPGQRDYVWAIQIDANPARLIIDAITEPGTPDHVRSDVAAIMRSIILGHWG